MSYAPWGTETVAASRLRHVSPSPRGAESRGEQAANSTSDHGHDKSIEIRKFSHLPADKRPTMFYAGDGVSDLSAAYETDLLFAKEHKGESPLPSSIPTLFRLELGAYKG